MMIYIPNVDPVNDYMYTKLVKFCPFNLKILSKNQIMTSIKVRNSIANLQKMTLYITDVDLVNDNVGTKVGLILSIRCQDIEQKQIMASIKGRNCFANLKNDASQYQCRSCQ